MYQKAWCTCRAVVLIIKPVVFLKSSLWSSSWLLKLPISRRVRTHEKNSGDAVRRLGTIIQSIFCAQSEASIRLTVWKWSGESPARLTAPGSPRMRRALLENLTDRCGLLRQKNSKTQRSEDKMRIDWVSSGQTEKYFALGQDARTSRRPRAKYFPLRVSRSVQVDISLGSVLERF